MSAPPSRPRCRSGLTSSSFVETSEARGETSPAARGAGGADQALRGGLRDGLARQIFHPEKRTAGAWIRRWRPRCKPHRRRRTWRRYHTLTLVLQARPFLNVSEPELQTQDDRNARRFAMAAPRFI